MSMGLIQRAPKQDRLIHTQEDLETQRSPLGSVFFVIFLVSV